MPVPILLLAAAAAGIAKGVSDKSNANKLKTQAKGLRPPNEDPEIRGYLGYLDRKRKAIEGGSYYQRQASEIGGQLADTQSGIAQSSGGAAGAAIAGNVRAQRGAGRAYASLVEGNAPMALQYDNMYQGVLERIEQRKADLQLHDYTSMLGDAAVKQKAGDEAIMGGIGMIAGAGGGGGLPTPKRTPEQPMQTLIPQRKPPMNSFDGLTPPQLQTTNRNIDPMLSYYRSGANNDLEQEDFNNDYYNMTRRPTMPMAAYQ